jgi:hypothetical protein
MFLHTGSGNKMPDQCHSHLQWNNAAMFLQVVRPGVYSASSRNEYLKLKKKKFLGSKVRLVRGADNLIAIYEPIV